MRGSKDGASRESVFNPLLSMAGPDPATQTFKLLAFGQDWVGGSSPPMERM